MHSFFGGAPDVPLIVPPINYIGSKLTFAKWIRQFIPPHMVWVDLFCGSIAASVNKPQSNLEVMNDIDQNLINFWRVVQNTDTFFPLLHRLAFAISSRVEFEEVNRRLNEQDWKDEIDRAYCYWYSKVVGMVSTAEPNWKRRKHIHEMKTNRVYGGIPDNDKNFDALFLIHNRMRKMQFESRDALLVLKEYDSPKACFFVDPPYDPSTRSKKLYVHEQDATFLATLVEILCTIEGSFIYCGYPSDVSKPLESIPGCKVYHRAGAKSNRKDEYLWVKRSGWLP